MIYYCHPALTTTAAPYATFWPAKITMLQRVKFPYLKGIQGGGIYFYCVE